MKVHAKFSAMAGGKSANLLICDQGYRERGMRTILYTAAVDTRAGVGIIASRLGIQKEARTFTKDTVFDQSILTDGVSAVLIDEAQFLDPRQIEEIHRLAHTSRVPFLCWGLRSDFMGKPFPGMASLLTLADEIEHIKTVCGCGKGATMNARFDENGNRVREGEQVVIGGNSMYASLCPDCFYEVNGAVPKLFTPLV